MKSDKIKQSTKIRHGFANLSIYTGYITCIVIVFTFFIHRNPDSTKLIPVARLFFEAAKVSVVLDKASKKTNEKDG